MNYKVIKGRTTQDGYEIIIPEETFGIVNGEYTIYDLDSNGYMLYEYGELVFEDGELIDFNGMQELPSFILNEISKIRKISL